MINELNSAIDNLKIAFSSEENNISTIINQTAQELAQHCLSWGMTLKQELTDSFNEIQTIGCPPPFIKIAGQKGYETPLNNLLEWWAKSDSEHGMTMNFLKKLAENINFETMSEDLQLMDMKYIQILANEKIPGSGSTRKPDLFVSTKKTLLLLENKTYSKETGGDQYLDYEKMLVRLAVGKETRALFCCPADYHHDTPSKPWCIREHNKLAQLFIELAKDEQAPFWGRIAAVITATAFDSSLFPYEEIERTAKILDKVKKRDILPHDLYSMEKQLNALTDARKTLEKLPFYQEVKNEN